MDNSNAKINSWSAAASLAAILAIIWIAGSTVLGELHAPFKDFLKATFSHHWIGKGVVSVALFLVALFIARLGISENSGTSLFLLNAVTSFAILGVLAITGYYFYADFL